MRFFSASYKAVSGITGSDITKIQTNTLMWIFIALLVVLLAAMSVLLFKHLKLNKNLEALVENRTRALERQTTTLSTIYKAIPDLVFCKDTNSVYTSCNPSFEKVVGCSEAELIGKTDLEIFNIDEPMARLFIEADQRVITHQTTETIEEYVIYPDKTVRLMETIKSPLIQNDTVIGMIGISRDITDRKEAESLLEKRLSQQSLMAALSQHFMVGGSGRPIIAQALQMAGEFLDIGRILLVQYEHHSLHYQYEWRNPTNQVNANPGIIRPMTEKEQQMIEAFAQRKISHYCPDDAELAQISQLYQVNNVKAFLMLPVFVGETLWGLLEFCQCDHYIPWSSSDIDLGEMIAGVLSGALTRMEIEKDLLRMSSIVNGSPRYISYVNSEGKFDFINPAACEVTGYSYEELMAGGVQLLYSEETNRLVRDELLPKIFAQGEYSFELPLIRKDGTERIMSFSAFTIMTDELACGSIATDITEQKQLEQQLIEAKELAEKNSRSKSEFLSRMSHEIRTPMNAIIGMTNIGRASTDITRKDYCLDKIDSASTHLLGVINDVLDMSKIEAGKFELSFTDFNLEKMLIKITNVINFKMEERGLHFTVHIGNDVPQAIVSDEQRLNQVITNLLGNAVKFTPDSGTVSLFVRKLSEENNLAMLQFEVQDTGIGISPEQQQRLFTSFEQADGSISRKYGGTGLGLAISKNIVEMLGGNIWVESELDKGSRFIFNIRAEIGKTAVRSTLSSEINWQNLRVLIVDDDPDVLAFFRHVSTSLSLHCATASDASEACRLMDSEGPYNIIFVDWQMPTMNGIELARQIKQTYGENTIIIMISATEWAHIETDAKQAGVDKFIPKPLFSSMIVDCINDCMDFQRMKAVTESASAEGPVYKGRRILLAEDVAINREIIMALLESTRVQIDCAENGWVAYEMFRENPNYDMIFMDVHMPEINGYEATQMIRALADPRAKTVPIIAMTANVFREDVEKCLAAGMNGHLGKPLDVDEVMRQLKQYFSSH